MDKMKRWIRRALIHKYFPEIWYLVENWLSQCSDGGRLLEIGCGRGVFTQAMVQDCWNVYSLDYSKHSLERAQERIAKIGKEVSFTLAQPEQLPFQDEAFEAITCINCLEFADNPLASLREAYRVLKPGGKGVVVVFRAYSFWSFRWVAQALRKDRPEKSYRCFKLSILKKLIVKSGFSVDSYKLKGRYIPFQPGKSVLPWPVSGAVVALLEKPLPGEKQIKIPMDSQGVFHK
ncbi:MAG: class I SAM-dependent methyltransferase [Bdellovibrionota bacterium]